MVASIIKSLRQTKRTYSDHNDYPKKPGIYAFFLSDVSDLGQYGHGGQLLYIGISKDSLHNRDFNQHFKSGQTGRSTFRRSLGAVLKDKLKLKAIPRGGLNDAKRYDNYKFISQCEEALSEWMLQNLEIGYWISEGVMDYSALREHEEAVIRQLHPTFDLDRRTKDLNPLASALTSLRNECKKDARKK
jgi:hypothetical protein